MRLPINTTEFNAVHDLVERSRLSPDEIIWVQRQPVCGSPDLARLRHGLGSAGFDVVKLHLSADAECLSFDVSRTDLVQAEDQCALLRLFITAFRAAGFAIGNEEMSVDVNGNSLSGHTLTGPLAEIAEYGAPQIER